MTRDTIYALSSGALPAAIAIVRVSGPGAEQAAERLVGTLPAARRASLREIRSGNGELIDQALVLRFPAPTTATGEPLIEFHLHGSRAVVARLLAELATLEGLREAEPGEFTRRALLNGRLDLTQAEGLADLLTAETEWQRRAAIESAGGALSRQVEAWRERLIVLSARAEAAIDYVGDEDETALDLAPFAREVGELAEEWRHWLAQPPSELLQGGLRVVLAGPPNSGKSSLFNALIGSEKAIVTPVAGTTRDVLEARLDVNGVPVILLDTAGLHSSDDEVERIGIARAENALRRADVLLWLGAPDGAPAVDHRLLIHARADERGPAPPRSIAVSVMSSNGLDELRNALREVLAELLPPVDRASLNRRQREGLFDALEGLTSVVPSDLLIVADGLRRARLALDRITGRNSTDEVLDALFGRFCLGK